MHPTLFPALLMHITNIEVHAICPPYCDFNALALARYHGARLQRRAILVVHTDNGLEGLGENIGDAPDGDALRAKYIGTSPFDWINAEQDLAMNMACYDLMGKHLDIPAWKLIGPKVRSWIPVAAWTVAQAPDAMAEEVRQVAARGYHWIKYHVDEMQDVIAQTEAMQEAGPRPISRCITTSTPTATTTSCAPFSPNWSNSGSPAALKM